MLSFLQIHIISHDPQSVFQKKRFPSPLKPFTSGYKLEDYVIGGQIGKGSNAAVYEAAAPFAPPTVSSKTCQVQLRDDADEGTTARPLSCCSLRNFPLAIKMMWNFGVRALSASVLPVLTITSIFSLTGVCCFEGWVLKRGHHQVHVAGAGACRSNGPEARKRTNHSAGVRVAP